MKELFNLPAFIFFDQDIQNLTKLKKLKLFFKGIYFIYVFKYTNGSFFCFCCNLIYRKNGKLSFENGMYTKKMDIKKIHYPNKRIHRVMVDYKKHLSRLFECYQLDKISFNKGDIIIDCGANVGELFYSFKDKNLDIEYIGIEPDNEVFKSLSINLKDSQILNKALGKENAYKNLYIDTEGANTSLVDFGSSTEYKVETVTLDSLNLVKIKLLKIDAEGYEPEVLEGAANTLSQIEYIAVDYGNERGIDNKSTLVEVTNFLYGSGFKLVAEGSVRKVGLFKNSQLS